MCEVKMAEESDYTIIWMVDEKGTSGKSTFCKVMEQEHDDVVVLRDIGSSRDVAHLLSRYNGLDIKVLVDISRSTQLYDNVYATLEDIRNGSMTSFKYNGSEVDVVVTSMIVFSNSQPDVTKFSADRLVIGEIK